MNCIDFRRDASVQPLRLGDEARLHAEGCPACRDFLERQRQLDTDLFDAIKVPVPDGLAERIVLARGMRHRRRWPWAFAASLVLTAGVAVLAPPYFAGEALAHEAIEHVVEEKQSFRLVAKHADELLAVALATQGIRLAAGLGEVTYAKFCPMLVGQAQHLVVATPDGPVTLLLLPSDSASRRRTVLDAQGMSAIALPASRGSIAIIAASRAQALAVERLLVFT